VRDRARYLAAVKPSPDLDERVERLIQALRVHAVRMAANEEGGAAMPAINEVREAALAYVEAVSEVTGWGNVFADLSGDVGNPVRRARLRRRLGKG
jgi:hypothetical protein